MSATRSSQPAPAKVSDQLHGWLEGSGEKTVGGFIDMFAEKSFALLFIVLLAVPALPLPTGGATHVFEIIAALLAVQLIAGRDEIWLPRRWRETRLGGEGSRRALERLVKAIRWLERFSRPRFRWVFNHRATNSAFGILVVIGCAAAFFAPPFTGLDTLPALGVVLTSLGVLLEDILFVLAGIVIIAVGIVLEIVLGKAAVDAFGSLL
jgi:hypothetical protein